MWFICGSGEETAELVEVLALDWAAPGSIRVMPQPSWLPPRLLSGVFPAVSDNAAQIRLGELFLTVGNLDLALDYFDGAIALGQVNDTVRFYRGIIFRANGEERQAAEVFRELDEAFLKQGAAHIFAGTIYAAAGNNRAALAAYQQGLDLGLRTEANYREIARLGQLLEDYPTAILALVELGPIEA